MLDLVVYLVVLSFVILHLSYVRERGRSSNLSKGCIVLNCRTMRNCMPDTVSVRDSATQVAAYVNGSGTALAHNSDMSMKGRAPCRHTIVVVPYMGQVRTGPEVDYRACIVGSDTPPNVEFQPHSPGSARRCTGNGRHGEVRRASATVLCLNLHKLSFVPESDIMR